MGKKQTCKIDVQNMAQTVSDNATLTSLRVALSEKKKQSFDVICFYLINIYY